MHGVFKDFRGYELATDYDASAWIECLRCWGRVYEFPFYGKAAGAKLEDLPNQLESAHIAVRQHVDKGCEAKW